MAKKPKSRPEWLRNASPELLRVIGRADPNSLHKDDIAFLLSASPEQLRSMSSAIIRLERWRGREELHPWILALQDIDVCDDKGPLLALLRSQRELPHDARVCLADLLERHQLKKYRGNQRIPAYRDSPAEETMAVAVECVNDEHRRGMSLDEALAFVAEEFKISEEETLRNARDGRRGSARRKR